MTIDPAVRAYYERRPEEDRLLAGPSQLEAARTRRLIERHAPNPPATVLDIGGAAGTYALWMAEKGYTVHLVDPVERLVEEARRRSARAAQPINTCRVGDARNLPFESGSADVALMLGPLYHLTSAEDRARALSEAVRVLKPGGLLFAAAISRWASALDGVARDLFKEADHADIVARALPDGQHRNPMGRMGAFTTAYFHRPDELRHEVARAGFEVAAVYAIEGLAGFLPDFDRRWADPRQRQDILRVAEQLETEPFLLGATPHLLAVGHKPAAA
ncbi:MAG: class I SAM-dependent methyltransferase [Longimicrobiales bacterium]